MEIIGTLPRCNIMEFHGYYLARNVSYNQCQVRYLEMLGTYLIGIIYMKLSGIEMS